MQPKVKQRALRRLKILAGQIRGLERMVGREAYCVEIINQSLAVKEALSSLEDLLLEHHLSTHVAEQMRSGRMQRAVREILDVYRLSRQRH